MIRKTFICVVGILAGASTGAYVDGFFERDNVVTRAFDDIANKFDSLTADASALNSINSANPLQSSSLTEPSQPGVADNSGLADTGSVRTTSAGTPQDMPRDNGLVSEPVSNNLGGSQSQSYDSLNQTDQRLLAAPNSEPGSQSKGDLAEDFQRPTMAVDAKQKAGILDQELDDRETSDFPKRDSESFLSDAKSIPSSPLMASADTNRNAVDQARADVTSADLTADDAISEGESKTETNLDRGEKTDSVAELRKAKNAQEIARVKAQALLDVRFTREVYRSPSGGQLKYRKLSPRVSDDRPLPLIVFLHGLGERGDDNVAQLKHGLQYLASREGMQEYPATVIAPQCPDYDQWTSLVSESQPTDGDTRSVKLNSTPNNAMRLTQELIASTIKSANVDPDRVYVTGLSMGGFGTYELVARMPSVFAAAVPLCGGGDTRDRIVNRIKHVPLWIIHGDQDSVVDVEYSRDMVAALQAAGASPRYSELTGFGHDIWNATYADRELYAWMFSKRRTDNGTQTVGARGRDQSNQSANASDAPASKSASDVTVQNVDSTGRTRTASFNGAITGNWKVLAATQQGRRADAATLAKMKVAIKGDDLLIGMGSRTESAKLSFPENESTTYPEVDIISLRKGVENSKGIFAKQGDKLVICWSMPGKERPSTFDSKEGVKTLVLQKR